MLGVAAIAPYVPELAAAFGEEVLLRWGLMTAFVWIGWQFIQRREGVPRPAVVWSAIVVSALLFGTGHLPAASVLAGPLTLPVVTYGVLGNAAVGLVAGWLFWRYGQEAAVLAHIGTHVGTVASGALLA